MKTWHWEKGGDCSLKKLIILTLAFFFLISLVTRADETSVARTDETKNKQEMVKNQLKGSIASTIEILEEMDRAKAKYGENSIVYEEAEKKLKAKKSRSDFVVWYYNYLKMIEKEPSVPDDEKELRKKLTLKEAERTCYKHWLEQAGIDKIDTEEKFKNFLKYHLMKDRFMILILRVYEKYDENPDIKDPITPTKEFLKNALTEPDPVDYILRDLRENIKIVREKTYKVKRRETLGGIAKKFGKKWQDIARRNGITDPRKLRKDQIIKISEYTVNIPKHIDKILQFCVLAADKLVISNMEKVVIAETTWATHKVESNEGRRIGRGNYHAAMHPSEKECFLKLCLRLGIDPETAPVSNKPPYTGWGGAMGSAQTLPSAWTAYEPTLYLLAPTKYLSPYNLKHAIFFTASLLVASRVASGGSEAERMATMRYFAGKNWNKAKFQFYWDRFISLELKKIRENGEIRKLIFTDKTN